MTAVAGQRCSQRAFSLARLLLFSLVLLLSNSLMAAEAVVTRPATVIAQAAPHTITLTGFTRARTVIDLSAEIEGKVEQLFAEIGEPIPADGRFAQLDTTFIDLALEQNRADQKRVEVEIAFLTKQTGRHQRLVRQKSSAQLQLDEIERSLAVSQQQLVALKVAEKIQREKKERLTIAAPPGALVIERRIEPGEWIDVGMPVGKVGDFSQLLIPLALSVSELKLLKNGGPIELHLADLDRTVTAAIERVSPAFDEQSHKIMVDLQVEGTNLRGGLRVQLSLTVADPSGAVLLPVAAVEKRYEAYRLKRPDGNTVVVTFLADAELNGQPMMRVVSPEVKVGEPFLLFH